MKQKLPIQAICAVLTALFILSCLSGCAGTGGSTYYDDLGAAVTDTANTGTQVDEYAEGTQPTVDTQPADDSDTAAEPEPEPVPEIEPDFRPAMSITDGRGVYYVYVDKNELCEPYMILSGWYDMTAGSVELPRVSDELALTHIQRVGDEDATVQDTLPDEARGALLVGIDDEAFYGCSLLVSVTIPETVEAIGDYAFGYCSALTDIALPESVITVGEGAFYCCWALTSADLPRWVESIGDKCFYGCTGLTSVSIGGSIDRLGESVFDGCSALVSVTLPDSIGSIGYRAFYGCSSLTDIKFPAGLEYIGDEAFAYSGLAALMLPEGLAEIGSYAFRGTNIDIHAFDGNLPKTVVRVGANPFADTPWMEPVRNDGGFLTLRGQYNFLVAYTMDSDEVYMFPGIQYICPEAFMGLDIEYIEIPDDVIEIGEGAFRGCTDLETVIIGAGVKVIGDYAFMMCTELVEIVIPDNVEYIGYDAFWNCSDLERVLMGDGVSYIDEYAFDNCDKLTVICSEGSYAYSRCKELGIDTEIAN